MVDETSTEQWIVSSANLYRGPETEARNALRASEFQDKSSSISLVDSGAYVSSIGNNYLDTIKQKAQSNILKINNPPIFQIAVGNGNLKKQLETTNLNLNLKTTHLPNISL